MEVVACRSCLNTNGKLEKIGNASLRFFTNLTSLEVAPNDGYPSYFCQECRTQIRRCMQFRRRARRAFFVLKEIHIVKKLVTFNDIEKVDRKKTNLESPYSTSATNVKIFDFTEENKRLVEVIQNSFIDGIKTEQQDQIKTESTQTQPKPENETEYDVKLSKTPQSKIPYRICILPKNKQSGENVKGMSIKLSSDNKSIINKNAIVKVEKHPTDINASSLLKKLVIYPNLSIKKTTPSVITIDEAGVKDQNSSPNINKPTKFYESKYAKQKKTRENKTEKPEAIKSIKLVDIKPANYKELEELERQELEREKKEREEARQKEIDACLNEIRNDGDDFDGDDFGGGDDTCNDVPEVVPEDIDMEDIFKGLAEKEVQSEAESLPEPEPAAPPPRKTYKKPDVQVLLLKEKKISVPERIRKLAYAIEYSHIRVLSAEEQKQVYLRRLLESYFLSSPFRCALCITVYNNQRELMEHVVFHQKEKQNAFSCSVCKRKFATELELTEHLAFMHWYEFQCNTCGKIYYNYIELQRCFKRHEKDGGKRYLNQFTRFPLCYQAMHRARNTYTGLMAEDPHKCTDCNIGFGSPKILKAHLKRHKIPKNAAEYFECDVCHLKFTNKDILYRHMRNWHVFWYRCNICHRPCMNKKQAQYHVENNVCCSTKVKTNTKCQWCGVSRPITAPGHEIKKHVMQFLFAHCMICGRAFKSLSKLCGHQLHAHKYLRLQHKDLGNPQYECVHCNVTFLNQKAYDVHAVALGHDEGKLVQFACHACRRVFKDEEAFQNHFCWRKKTCNTQVPESRTIRCCYCDAKFSTHKEYTVHMHTVHTGMNYLPLTQYILCEICGKTVHKGGIKQHEKSHNETILKIDCMYCHETSKDYPAAVNHILIKHAQKPWLCAKCPARFPTRCMARDHILKVHAPVLLYYCIQCDRRFAHLDYLHEHSLKIHGVNVKQDRSVFLARTRSRRVVVYPHMKIDGTLVSKELLKKAEIEICDYMDQNHRILENYLDYVEFKDPDNVVILKGKTKRYKYKYDKQRHKQKDVTIKNEETQTYKLEYSTNEEYVDSKTGILRIKRDLYEQTDKKSAKRKRTKNINITDNIPIKLEKRIKIDSIEEDAKRIEEALMHLDYIEPKNEDIKKIEAEPEYYYSDYQNTEEVDQSTTVIDQNDLEIDVNRTDMDENTFIVDQNTEQVREEWVEETLEEFVEEPTETVTDTENSVILEVDHSLEKMEIDASALEHYQMVEIEGQQYVMVNDILYRVERE